MRTVILGVGTVALDTVETPAGSVRDVPGGSALYFAAAASHLGPVAVAGVTGEDFPVGPLAALVARGVDVSGIARVPDPTFRWHARYDGSGRREILSAHRGGIERRGPTIPPSLEGPDVLFLGSMDPVMQHRCLDQARAAGIVVLDTMSHWIRDRREELDALLARVDVLLVNETEARTLGGRREEEAAAEALRSLGPRWVVVKRGARGACAYRANGRVEVGAAPVEAVVDPTGAGDAFAGGLVMSLARGGGLSAEDMRDALGTGASMGALAVRAFSIEGLMEGGEGRTSDARSSAL
jgi:sugar/nucleoside kinase (ribokinase family)